MSKELWVKKTIWRRYLIEDSNIEVVTQILTSGGDEGDELVVDCYDFNSLVEYDNEKVILPVQFEIKDILNNG